MNSGQVLTDLDDTMRHMAPTTLNQVATTDHRFFDRYWYTVVAPDRSIALVTGLGAYANMNVMDGYVCVVISRDDQKNLRVSRRLRPDIERMGSGPLDYKSLEPHRRSRLMLAANAGPLTFDLEYTATEGPRLESPHQTLLEGHLVENYLRITQLGAISGTISIGDRRWEAAEWFAARDHSWGVRRFFGGFWPRTATPVQDDFSGLFCWVAWRAGRYQGYVQIQEGADGVRRFLDGDVAVTVDGTTRSVRVVEAEHDIEFVGNSNIVRRIGLKLRGDDGETYAVEIEPAHIPLAMIGSGYFDGFDDGLGMGVYRGDDIQQYDEYQLFEDGLVGFPDGRRGRPWHRELLVVVTCNAEVGTGYTATLVEGKIERYGLDLPPRSEKGNGVTYER
jgi:hypothetical protein